MSDYIVRAISTDGLVQAAAICSRSRCSGGCRSGSRGSSNRSSAVGVFFNGNVVSNAVHGNSQVFHKKGPP